MSLAFQAGRTESPQTVDELLELPDNRRYELIDGRLSPLEHPPAHRPLTLDLCNAMELNCPADALVVPGVSLAVDQHNEFRPDVVVINIEHATLSPVPVTGVLLAVDVISPLAHFRDIYAKTRIYAAAGVPEYWLVDPMFAEGIVLSRLRLGVSGTYEMVSSTREVCRTGLPFPVTIDLPALSADRRPGLRRGR